MRCVQTYRRIPITKNHAWKARGSALGQLVTAGNSAGPAQLAQLSWLRWVKDAFPRKGKGGVRTQIQIQINQLCWPGQLKCFPMTPQFRGNGVQLTLEVGERRSPWIDCLMTSTLSPGPVPFGAFGLNAARGLISTLIFLFFSSPSESHRPAEFCARWSEWCCSDGPLSGAKNCSVQFFFRQWVRSHKKQRGCHSGAGMTGLGPVWSKNDHKLTTNGAQTWVAVWTGVPAVPVFMILVWWRTTVRCLKNSCFSVVKRSAQHISKRTTETTISPGGEDTRQNP